MPLDVIAGLLGTIVRLLVLTALLGYASNPLSVFVSHPEDKEFLVHDVSPKREFDKGIVVGSNCLGEGEKHSLFVNLHEVILGNSSAHQELLSSREYTLVLLKARPFYSAFLY